MSTAPPAAPPTAPTPTAAAAIDAFNLHLAHAKLGALKLLQDLIASLTDLDAEVGQGGGALREIRLAATAILRAKPMSSASRASPPSPTGRGNVLAQQERGEGARQDPAPQDSTPQDPGLPAPPTYRGYLNPTVRAARRDIRDFIRDGCPEVVNLFLKRPAAIRPP